MPPYKARINECGHPERKHQAKGKCAQCYHLSPKQRQYREDYANSNRRRDQLKHHYGITIEQYDAMLAKQNGVCAICQNPPRGKMKRLSVDHDHITGAVRGLLCITCNRTVGYLDNATWADSATQYLQAHKEQQEWVEDAKNFLQGTFPK